jgi:hypothetical protein
MMATQSEVIEYIRANFSYSEHTNDFMKVVFGVSEGRSQLVYVLVTDFDVQFKSIFGTINDFSHQEALEANADYSLGIQLDGELYMVKHVVLLENLELLQIRDGFYLVAEIADLLERQLRVDDTL